MRSDNLVRLFGRQVARRADSVAFQHRRDGLWHPLTWRQWDDRASSLAAGLLSLGVEPGDPVAVLSRNSGAWPVIDMGVLMAASVTVPIPQGLTPDELVHVLELLRPRVVFVDAPFNLARLAAAGQAAQLAFERVIVVEEEGIVPVGRNKGDLLRVAEVFEGGEPPWLARFDEFLQHGDDLRARFGGELVRRREEVLTAESPALVIFTSGSTGLPKGAQLTHGNLLFEIERLAEVLPISDRDEQLLFLPLSHVLGNVVYRSMLLTGSRLAIGEGETRLLENLREVNPTWLTAVPSFCEKLADRLRAAARERGIPGVVFDWARDASRERGRGHRATAFEEMGLRLQRAVAERLVLRRVRSVVGTRLRFLICGGAHLPPHVGEFLHAAGIPVLEGYGLTETTAATHVNRPERPGYGTVGLPLRGVECRLSPEAEIQVRGGNVMSGYYRDPAATRDAFSEDGWYRTGDLGVLDPEGRLIVTGKAKEILVLSNGRNVSPVKVEVALRASPFVARAVVFGDNQPHLVALVVIDEARVRERLGESDEDARDMAALVRDPDVIRLIERELESASAAASLPRYERVARFALLSRELSPEAGELTDTQKLRRDVIGRVYADVIRGLYA